MSRLVLTLLLAVAFMTACARRAPAQPPWLDAYTECSGRCRNDCALHQSEVFVMCGDLCDKSCKDSYWPRITFVDAGRDAP